MLIEAALCITANQVARLPEWVIPVDFNETLPAGYGA
jgi:hypothetical protein